MSTTPTTTSTTSGLTGSSSGSWATSTVSRLLLSGLGVLFLVLAALSWARAAGAAAGSDFELLGSATGGSTVTVEIDRGPVSIWSSQAGVDRGSCSVTGPGSPKILAPAVGDRLLDTTPLYAVASVSGFSTGTISCAQEFYVGATPAGSSGAGLGTYLLAATGAAGLLAAAALTVAGRRTV